MKKNDSIINSRENVPNTLSSKAQLNKNSALFFGVTPTPSALNS